MGKEERTELIGIRLTPTEQKALYKMARKFGTTVAELIRRKTLYDFERAG